MAAAPTDPNKKPEDNYDSAARSDPLATQKDDKKCLGLKWPSPPLDTDAASVQSCSIGFQSNRHEGSKPARDRTRSSPVN